MPEPTTAPRRSGSTCAPSRPASFQASRAAISANCAERSSRRRSTGFITSLGSTATRAAMRTGSPSAQSSVSGLTPDRPASSAAQDVATSPPSGVVAPRPVTTTVRRGAALSVDADKSVPICTYAVTAFRKAEAWAATPPDGVPPGRVLGRAEELTRGQPGVPGRPSTRLAGSASAAVREDVADRVADGVEVLDLVVRDLHVELLLGGDHDLDHGQRVDVQVAGERLVQLDLALLDPGHFVHDLGEAREDFFLGSHFPVSLPARIPVTASGGLRGAKRVPRARVHQTRAAYIYGNTTTCAAYTRPAPKPISSAAPPCGASPSSSIRSIASGMDAAEVLPWVAMSRATGTCSGSLSALIIASVIRMFAWCGMNASSWSAVIPARSSAFFATGTIW